MCLYVRLLVCYTHIVYPIHTIKFNRISSQILFLNLHEISIISERINIDFRPHVTKKVIGHAFLSIICLLNESAVVNESQNLRTCTNTHMDE